MKLISKARGLSRCGKSVVDTHARSISSCGNHDNGVGLLFDIDGVILRGRKLIPAAKDALMQLCDSEGKFAVPTVFVTNAGNTLCKTKADQLSSILDMQIDQDQVMLSHSPLRMFQEYHDKCVLLSGQGPIEEIAKRIGFTNTITINDVRSAYPFLDMVDHKPRPAESSKYTAGTLPKIDAVVLVGEPTRWETNLQLIIDVLMTNGTLENSDTSGYGEQRVPVLACNMDLQWMSDFSMPRFGHGMFMHCLESVYLKLVGRPLLYSALIGKPSTSTYQYAEQLIIREARKIGLRTPIHTLYAIGDNPMADIYGANLYNRVLKRKSLTNKQESRTVVTANDEASNIDSNDENTRQQQSAPSTSTVKRCHSVLVCTGVYNHDSDDSPYTKPPVFHGPRDMEYDLDLCEPNIIADDAHVAVQMIMAREKQFNSAPVSQPQQQQQTSKVSE